MSKPGRTSAAAGGGGRSPGTVSRVLFGAAVSFAAFFLGYGARLFHDGGSDAWGASVAGGGADAAGRRPVVAAAAAKAVMDNAFAAAAVPAPPVRELEAEEDTPTAQSLSSATSPAEAALEQLLAHPMAGCPTKWLQTLRTYAAWHAEQVALLRARSPAAAKVVVYSCAETVDETTVVGDDCGGFADRLVGVAHLFVYALLYKRVFFVDWSSGGRQLPPAVFHGYYFNYTYDEDLVVYPGRSVEMRERHFNGCPDHQGPCVLQLPDPDAAFPADVTLTRINKGPVRYSTDAVRARLWDELGLAEANVGGCLLRALVQPNRETVDAFREWALRLLDPGVHVVAMHVRTGDKSMHLLSPRPDGYGAGDKYWTCAMKLVKESMTTSRAAGQRIAPRALKGTGGAVGVPSKAVVFISVDDVRYKQEAVARYGNATVWATDVRPWHISKLQLWWDGFVHRKDKFPNPWERLRDTFGEWWLLSLGDDFVMPGFSGYSRTAFAYSQKPSGRNVENYEGRGLCCCDTQLGQKDLAYLGGGY